MPDSPKRDAHDGSARKTYCLTCGYCLLGLSKRRCPECGRDFDPDDEESFADVPRDEGILSACRVCLVASWVGVALFFSALVRFWWAGGTNPYSTIAYSTGVVIELAVLAYAVVVALRGHDMKQLNFAALVAMLALLYWLLEICLYLL